MRVAALYRVAPSVVATWAAADVLLAALWSGRLASERQYGAAHAAVDAGTVMAVAFHEPKKLRDLRQDVEQTRPAWLAPVRPTVAPEGWDAAWADVPLTTDEGGADGAAD